MGATIELFKSSILKFDLDTRRPWFKNQETAESYMSGKTKKTWRSTNWNRIGDPMIAPLSFTEASGYDIGMITLETGPNQMDGTKYWFRVRDVRVNETNRTEIVYDIDFLQTFADHLAAGHIDRVPKMTPLYNKTGFGRGVVLNPRRWVYDASVSLCPYGVHLVIVATKATISGQTVEGPVYFYGTCQWMQGNPEALQYTNPIGWLAKQGVIAVGDIVNAWAVPGVFPSSAAPTDTFRYWGDVFDKMPAGSPIKWIKYTNSTPLAHLEATVTIAPPDSMKSGLTYPAIDGTPEEVQYPVLNGTDTVRGLLSGICDERGNILYTFKDKTYQYCRFYCAVNVSMASCELDIVFNGDSEGFISGHTTDNMVTYSCRPIDVIANSWQEYLFRQRAADIENRNLQNEAGLAGGVGNAGSSALTGAVMGSIVPGIGTAAGAIAGGITSIVGSAVNYGVQSVYGDKMQRVTDKLYQLAQDKVAVNGMITSYQLALQQTLYLFQLHADGTTMSEIETQLDIEGQMDDRYVPNVRSIMNNLFTDGEFRPFAATCEVDFDMPASWKKTISAQLAAGARYKKFGTWTTT